MEWPASALICLPPVTCAFERVWNMTYATKDLKFHLFFIAIAIAIAVAQCGPWLPYWAVQLWTGWRAHFRWSCEFLGSGCLTLQPAWTVRVSCYTVGKLCGGMGGSRQVKVMCRTRWLDSEPQVRRVVRWARMTLSWMVVWGPKPFAPSLSWPLFLPPFVCVSSGTELH